MGKNDYGLSNLNNQRNQNGGGASTGITELRNGDSQPTRTAQAQERSLQKAKADLNNTGMTDASNIGPNKVAPIINQDGNDIKVDLEGSMPKITEAHGV